MVSPIRFYFDFASPYAWFALDAIEKLARDHGRVVEWRPVLVWAVLKAHGIAPPLDVAIKREYLLADMMRSAAFHRVPYRPPAKLPTSSHLASRLHHAIAVRDPERAKAFGRDVFASFLVTGEDIADENVVLRLAARRGIAEEEAREAMKGPIGRARLAATIDAAIADKVCGSPFFILDGEPFFGADRLDQIAWRLSSRAVPGARALAEGSPAKGAGSM
jgi:2-hydroxychromene-2-carboxylate isomerase